MIATNKLKLGMNMANIILIYQYLKSIDKLVN